MSEDTKDPGVIAPPADPATGDVAAPEAPKTDSEVVTNPEESKEQTVPFTRFQEVNDKAKQAQEKAEKLEAELAAAKAAPNSEDEVDPEVVELVKKSAGKLGFVTKAELDQKEMEIQVRQDVKDLEAQYADSGLPYKHQDVIDYAKTNNLPITSKAALRAAYRDMNYDKIVEAERNKAITDYKEGGKSTGEKPGSEGSKLPPEPKVTSIKERISAARAKL